MEEKINFIQMLYNDFMQNIYLYIKSVSESKENSSLYYWSPKHYMNKNYGKSVLKRKIIFLRQELLNLEHLLDEVEQR